MNVAVIFAGGSGLRMNNAAIPKQFLRFHDKPILIHTLERFQEHPGIDAISMAVLPDWLDRAQQLADEFHITKLRWLVPGGRTGQLSIHAALQAIECDDPANTTVLMHDGVRPLIDTALITRVIEQVHQTGTAVTAHPTVETSILSCDHATVSDVLTRTDTFTAQAPQAFRLDVMLDCHARALADDRADFIDSCSLFRAYRDEAVHLVQGSRSNIKITTPEDYYIFQALYDLARLEEIQGL
ncbi:MAG: 2-C-methyl-D-erythritol 4-phosphate cytidylyltransferase [Actinomycetes bacterium]|jgi:2-C-methyl-D-erythritol 4-phosphate cytidylyltransferase|nr:2-C-methyl-D-erythritol 4-phosphate cytidylyltransferase [Actinomycetes bacterium]